MARTRTQYRLRIVRETDEGELWSKWKTFFSRSDLNRYIGMIASDRPWEHMRQFAGKGPDDPACSYFDEGCGCDECASGTTVRQHCDEIRAKYWPVVGFSVEVRKVATTPWESAADVVTVDSGLQKNDKGWGEMP